MVSPPPDRCRGATASGSPCLARPVRPDGFCWWHSPAAGAQRDAARKRGGADKSNAARARRRYAGEPMTLREVRGVLSAVLKDVVAGEVEPGVATAAASVARAIAAVAQAGDLGLLQERLGLIVAHWRRRPTAYRPKATRAA